MSDGPSVQHPTSGPAAPPPGWYFDGVQQRWWDGTEWGPPAQGGGHDSGDRTLATLSHLGALFGGFILPLVMYLISDEEKRPETRSHAREALNFQLTFLVVYLVAFVVMLGGILASGGFASDGEAAAVGLGIGAFVVFFVLVFGASIAAIVFGIIGAVRANKGVDYRYPVCIRFVRS